MHLLTVLRSRHFLIPFIITGVLTGLIFAWELNMFFPQFPGPPRPHPTHFELRFTQFILLLLALDAGFIGWRSKHGSCPTGTKKATTISCILGIFALLCPACIFLPITLFGVSISLLFFAPYVPLIRTIVAILLVASTVMLWPKKP